MGMNYLNINDFMISFSTGYLQIGEETITERPYDTYADYLEGPFPSGSVKKNHYFEAFFSYWYGEDFSILSRYYWSPKSKIFNLEISMYLFDKFL